RAVYELSAELRAAALEALVARPFADFRKVLLDGLRYPWPAAAEHAAEALAALDDKKAVPWLITLLKEPDPRDAGGSEPDKLLIREVIKANHVTNCLLCHAPAINFSDPVTAPVPGIFWQAPTTMSSSQIAQLTGQASGGGKGWGGSGGSGGGSGGDSGGGTTMTFLRTPNGGVTMVPKKTPRVRLIRLPVLVR